VGFFRQFVSSGNRTDAIQYPSDKAMLFERFDFSLKSRLGANGARFPYPPQFNNPDAKPNTTWADGSVSKANVRDMLAAATGTPEEQAMYKPPGKWGSSSGMTGQLLSDYSSTVFDQGLDIPHQLSGLEEFPEFMWGTRNGIAGRDKRK
jgi:hypothetical protein